MPAYFLLCSVFYLLWPHTELYVVSVWSARKGGSFKIKTFDPIFSPWKAEFCSNTVPGIPITELFQIARKLLCRICLSIRMLEEAQRCVGEGVSSANNPIQCFIKITSLVVLEQQLIQLGGLSVFEDRRTLQDSVSEHGFRSHNLFIYFVMHKWLIWELLESQTLVHSQLWCNPLGNLAFLHSWVRWTVVLNHHHHHHLDHLHLLLSWFVTIENIPRNRQCW